MAVQVFSIMLFTLLNEGLTNAPLVFLAASDNLIKEDKEVKEQFAQNVENEADLYFRASFM